MTRLILLSDIHGNLPALKAVLADAETRGTPDAIWVLGDLAAFCPWPGETLARLRELPNAAFLQGNTDRYLVTGRRPALPVHSLDDWANVSARLAERSANFRWTVERLSYANYEFLRDLPPRLEMEVPGYGRIVAVHATPADDEATIYPDTDDAQALSHLAGLDARLLLYGHTHCPLDRVVGNVRLINDGSVGLPLDGDPRPAYASLDFEGKQCTATIHRVEYDQEAVIVELERVGHPAQEWVVDKLRQ